MSYASLPMPGDGHAGKDDSLVPANESKVHTGANGGFTLSAGEHRIPH